MKLTKNFKKTMAVIMATLMLLVALPLTTASAAEDTVYPGGEVKVTYSFAKDIWCTPCYFFEGKFDANVLEFKNDENHWSITPMVVPHDGYVSAAASSAYGVEVKPGDKIISYYYKVIGETNVNSIDFGFIQFQLYDDDGVELDASYVTYSVEVLSRGEEPTTEPTTTEPKILYGDVDGDGIISIQDATMIQKFGVGINTPEVGSDLFELADVNDDGRISILDVTCIQKYLVGGYTNTGLVGK